MTRKDKQLISKRLRLEVQAKISPVLDVVYSVGVVLVGYYVLTPHLPPPVGWVVTGLLLVAGLRLRGGRQGLVTRRGIVGLLKALVKMLDGAGG